MENWAEEEETKTQEQPSSFSVPDFSFQEETGTGKMVVTIFGDKGVGKTTMAYTFPGKIATLSFDNKSQHPKVNYFSNDNRISVFNITRYLVEDKEFFPKSAMITYDFIKATLKHIEEKVKPDWIVLDGMEEISKIAEMVMRYNNKIGAFDNFANRNLWKERRLVIRDIHRKSLQIAKLGLIYTTYIDKDEIVEEGTTIVKKDIPKWIDVVMLETDIVLKVEQNYDKLKGNKVIIHVITSKYDNIFKTGEKIDITDKKDLERWNQCK